MILFEKIVSAKTIKKNAQELLVSLNDISEIAKIDSGKYTNDKKDY